MHKLPNFNHLYYFWTIAHEGSIKKASQKLNLTQPGLSSQLKALETRFNKKLFDRKTRKLVLNDTGKIVLDYCSRIFNLSDEMELAIKQKLPKKKDCVEGWGVTLALYHQYPRICGAFMERYIYIG